MSKPTLGCGRRDLLRATGGVLAGSVLGTTASAAASGTEELWRFDLPGTGNSPTVVNGTVYVGSDDFHRLYAVDAESGEEKWHFEIESGPVLQTGVQVVDGTAYVADYDATLYAVDAESGEEVWTFDMGSGGKSPTVAGGTVFIPTYVPSTENGHMVAVDAESGEEVWRVETTEEFVLDPTVYGDTVIVGNDDRHLYAFDVQSGEERWRSFLRADLEASATVVDDTVFVGSGHDLYALDVVNGETLWEFPGGEAVRTAPTVANGTVYFGTADETLYAVDAATSEEQWRFEGFDHGVYTAPTVADGVVYAGGTTLYGLDADSGEELGSYETDRMGQAPIVVEGVVYVLGGNTRVMAFDAVGDGSSEDSRVLQGTLGHHDGWTGDPTPLSGFDLGNVGENVPEYPRADEPSEGTGTEETGGDEGTDGDDSESSADTEGSDASASDEGDDNDGSGDGGSPGFGVGAGLAALGGVSYVLKRREGEDER